MANSLLSLKKMMMDERLRWARILNKLIKRNFQIAKTYNKLIAVIPNQTITKFLEEHISRVVECAKELEQEIVYLEIEGIRTKNTIYHTDFKSKSMKLLGANIPLLLHYCIKQKKSNIKLYRKALTRINEGAIREKLIRHISLFEGDLKDLKLLKIKLGTRKNRNDTLLNSP